MHAGHVHGSCDDLAHRHGLRATDLEGPLDGGVLLQAVGGQAGDVAHEDRSQLLAAEVGQGHEGQAFGRSRGSD